MAFVDDQDLAAMFATDDFAEAASWAPSAGGAAVPCEIIFDASIDTAGIGFAGLSAANRKLLVRVSEIADPRLGAFTIEAAVYRVAEADLDITRQVWTCSLNPTV